MKKLNYLLLGLVAMGLTFTSCEEDEDALGPDITFKAAGAGYVTGDSEVNVGDTVKFSFEVTKGDAKLESFTIRSNDKDLTGYPNTSIDKEQYEDVASKILEEVGSYKFTFIATDRDGLQATKTLTITAKTNLKPQGEAQLGAGSSSLPSYYSVSEAKAMSLSDAKASPTKVDFVFTSTASEATFISPKDASATEVKNVGYTTKYKKVDFDFATATIADVVAVTPTEDNIKVAAKDVIVFETEDGTKGVFEVTSLAVAADGTVTIDIMIK